MSPVPSPFHHLHTIRQPDCQRQLRTTRLHAMSSSSRHNSPPLLGLNSFPLPSSGSYPSNRNKSSRSRSKHSMTPPSFLFGDDSTPAPYPSASTNGLQISSPERSPGVRSVKPPGTPSPWYGSNLYGRAPTILGDTHTNSPYHAPRHPPASGYTPENQPHLQPQYTSVTPESPFWEMYNTEATKTDKDVTQGWTSGIDVLLIITGLFSSIVTGFLVMEINPDTSDAQALVMARYLVAKARFTTSEAANLSPAAQRELFEYLSAPPEPSARRETIVACWSVSLTCTLCIVIYAFYIKFWLREYERDMKNGSAFECAQRRQARWAALVRWKVEAWISFLPVLMLVSVGLFIVGLTMKLWISYNKAAIAVISVSGTLLSVYFALSILPWFHKSCPYHNTALVLIPQMFSGIGSFLENCGKRVFTGLASLRHRVNNKAKGDWDIEKSLPVLPLHFASARVEEEDKYITSNKDRLTWDAVIWLLSTSRQSFIVDRVLRAFPFLTYTPKKATALLATRIPQMLCSRIYGEFTVNEEDQSSRLDVDLDDDKMASSFQFSLGFTHYLKCLALDGTPSRDILALVTASSESTCVPSHPSNKAYHLLDERLMNQWKLMKGAETLKSYVDLQVKGWVPDTFVALASMEALYFHLHPDNQKPDPPINDPLDDVHFFLEWHIASLAKGTHNNNERVTLVILLNTLAHTLGTLSDEHEWMKRRRHKILLVLLRLVRVMTSEEFHSLQPLADCIWLCLRGTSREHVRQILEQNINHSTKHVLRLQAGPNGGYKNLFTALSMISKEELQPDDDDDDSDHFKSIVGTLFLLASHMAPHHSSPKAANFEEVFIANLDDVFAEIDNQFNSLALHYDQTSINCQWVVDFLFHVYGLSTPAALEGRSVDVTCRISNILSCTVRYPDEWRKPIILKILTFFKERIQHVDTTRNEKEHLCDTIFDLLKRHTTEHSDQLLIQVVTEEQLLSDLKPIIILLRQPLQNAVVQVLKSLKSSNSVDTKSYMFNALKNIFIQ